MPRWTRRLAMVASPLAVALSLWTILSGTVPVGAAEASPVPLATAGVDVFDPTDGLSTPVHAIVEANGRWYIGGDFQTVAGEPQPYLAAIEVSTGRLDQLWRPQVNGEVESIAVSPDGSSVFIGGKFNNVSGSWRRRIAKLDATTGQVDADFNPGANATVTALITDGASVWAGGTFSTIGATSLEHLAKLDASTGLVDAGWTTAANNNVLDLELVGSTLYAAGNFTDLGGVPVSRIGALDASTGAVHAFTPSAPFKVYDISVHPDGTTLYSAGAGSLGAGGNSLQAFDTATGGEVWRRVGSGDFQAVVATDELVYAGSHGEYIYIDNDGPFLESDDNPNAVRRDKLAAFEPLTGALDDWNPGANSVRGVWELAIGPTGLLVGGDFIEIGGVTQPHFAVFDGAGSGNRAPTPSFSHDCVGTTCTFDASASSDPDGTVGAHHWDFGDGQTATGTEVTVTLGDDRLHTVRLTTTDDLGASANTITQVVVGDGGLDAELVEAAVANGSSASLSVVLPPTALVDDVSIAILTLNNPAAVVTPPPGWTLADEQTAGSSRSQVWHRTLAAADAGSTVIFTFDQTWKADLSIATFRHLDVAAPFASVEALPEALKWGQHSAPAVTTTGFSTVVHYWADRTLTTTRITAPGDEAIISTSVGTGSAHISSTLSLSPQVGGGSVSARAAVANTHSTSAIGWTIALTAVEVIDPPPSCTAVVDPNDVVTLTWDPQEADSYIVRRNGSWLASPGDVLTFSDSPGPGSWDYLVRTVVAGTTIDTGCTPTVIVDDPPPVSQTCTATDNGDGTITLDWTAIPGEDKYIVRHNGSWLANAGAALTFTDAPGVGTHSYAIRSKLDGTTTNTTCSPPITIDDPPPITQTCTATDNGDGTITLDWTAIPGEDNYVVRRNDSWLASPGNVLTHTDPLGQPTDVYVIRSKLAGVTTNTTCIPAA